MMRRFTEDMDRLFDFFDGIDSGESNLFPQIEVSHQGNKLLVQADVPGMKREDVNVEIRDDELCISGQRKSEYERTEGGMYRSERRYGSFCRTIPLPEGTKLDTANATFEDGVLKVELECETENQSKARRIEVREGSAESRSSSQPQQAPKQQQSQAQPPHARPH